MYVEIVFSGILCVWLQQPYIHMHICGYADGLSLNKILYKTFGIGKRYHTNNDETENGGEENEKDHHLSIELMCIQQLPLLCHNTQGLYYTVVHLCAVCAHDCEMLKLKLEVFKWHNFPMKCSLIILGSPCHDRASGQVEGKNHV